MKQLLLCLLVIVTSCASPLVRGINKSYVYVDAHGNIVSVDPKKVFITDIYGQCYKFTIQQAHSKLLRDRVPNIKREPLILEPTPNYQDTITASDSLILL